MKYNLGKIGLLLFFIPFSLFAKVNLDAPLSFIQGDFVEFKITASGGKVEFPEVREIDGYPVQILGKSMQTNIVNGALSQQIVQTFTFKPDKDVTIPAFEIKINGQIEKTEPKKLIMAKVAKTVSDLFDFEIEVNKTNPFVGEDVILNVIFKYRKDINIVDLEFEKPHFGGFWVQQLKKSKIKMKQDPRYHYQSLQFLLFPQKKGKLELGPFKIGAITMDGRLSNSFFLNGSTNKQSVYSNSITMDVKELPQGVRLIGEFELDTTVDKMRVKQGEAISYKVNIKGIGNVDDIPEPKLDIPSATMYENPSKKEYSYTNGKYGGEFTKVYSIVPSRDFTIPSITLKYFDKASGEIKTLQSKEYTIKVEEATKKETTLQTSTQEGDTPQVFAAQVEETVNVPLNIYEKITYFFLGAGTIAGILLLLKFIQNRRRKKTKIDLPLHRKINQTYSKNELLQIMAVYINIDKDLDKIIYQIEGEDDPKALSALKKEAVKLMKTKKLKGLS